MYIKNVPISSAPFISSNCLENTVATININVVIIKYIFPNIDLAIFVTIFVSGIIPEINTKEVDEIIALKLNDLGGLKSKLTYNNVWNFNKNLVKDKVLNSEGKPFTLYGYTFWASSYNGEDYYGKAKIDEIKSSKEIVLAGESFSKEVQDILILVDKYKDKPQELSKKLVKIFESDRKKMDLLSEQNKKLNKEITSLREQKKQLEEGFTTVFYNSIYTDNSMNDVMSINKSGDSHMLESLKTMFNEDENKLNQILSPKKQGGTARSNLVNLEQKMTAKQRLHDLFGD